MAGQLFAYLVTHDAALARRQRDALAGEVDLCLFHSAAECRAGLEKHRPDALLIDFGMPDDEGFRLHRELREDFDLGDLYQIPLCTEAQIGREGFAPDDFLIHPVADAALRCKLALLRKLLEEKAGVRDQMAYAQNVAFTSMSAMGELGVVMQFLSRSFACRNIQSVADLGIESLRQYDLEGGVYVIWEGDYYAPTTSGEPMAAAQRELVVQRRTLGRILEIEKIMVVNFDHVTVLITNLPTDDPQRVGRIRDNIATLAEGIESRVQGLLLEHDNILKQQAIRYAAREISDSVADLHARQQADLLHTRELVNHVIDDFESAFMQMALHNEHENQMIGDLVELRRKVAEIIGRPGEVHEKLKIVIAALETMSGSIGAG